MVAHRAGALTVAVVAVAMLFAIGSWEVYTGAEALAQVTEPPEVQYKCYVLAETREGAVRERVSLSTEQFEDQEDVRVMEPLLLCTPPTKVRTIDSVVVTTPPGLEEEGDLPDILCYKIIPSGPPLNVRVSVTDQFRTDQTVRVTASELLCVEVRAKSFVD